MCWTRWDDYNDHNGCNKAMCRTRWARMARRGVGPEACSKGLQGYYGGVTGSMGCLSCLAVYHVWLSIMFGCLSCLAVYHVGCLSCLAVYHVGCLSCLAVYHVWLSIMFAVYHVWLSIMFGCLSCWLSIMFGCLSCLADGLCLLVLANNKANKRYRADALQELMGSDKTLKGRVVKRHTQTRQRELC